jgi:aspartyl/asparaginyl beta-hydroxylase (cupin superfamily)
MNRLRSLWKIVWKRIGYASLRPLEWMIERLSLVGGGTFFDTAKLPWTRDLEADWRLVRSELDRILESQTVLPQVQDILEETAAISHDDRWKTYYFYNYGTKFPRSCSLCPGTTRLIESLPGMKTAFFSILTPGKHIPAHRGPWKGVLRAHLALVVPKDRENCFIRVGSDTRAWEEGKVMVFDDTYDHEVFNNTTEVRVILFLDVVRPLPFPLSRLNEWIIDFIAGSIYMRDLNRNQRRWEERSLHAVAKP